MTTTSFSTPRDLLRYAVTRFNGAKPLLTRLIAATLEPVPAIEDEITRRG